MKKKYEVGLNISQLLALIGLIFATFTWMSGGIEAIAYSFYSLLIVILFILIFIKRNSSIDQINKISVILLAFLILCCFSLVWSINRYDTSVGIIVLIISALVYEVSLKYLSDEKLYRLWKNIYIVFATASVLWGIPNYFINTTDGRFINLIYWPNVTAVTLVPAIFLAFYGFVESKKRYASVLYLAASSLLGAAFVLTFSRAAYLLLVILLFVLLALHHRNKRFLFVFLTTTLLSLLLSFGLYQIRAITFNNTKNVNITTKEKVNSEIVNNSIKDRSAYWSSSFNMIRDNLILGSGYGTFKSNYPRYQKNASAETNDPHSFLLKSLSELGVLSLMLLALLVMYLFKKGIGKKNDLEFILVISSFFMILGHALLDTDLLFPCVLFNLTLFLGIIASKLNDNWSVRNNILAKSKNSIKIIWVLLSLIIILTSIFCFNYFLLKNSEEALFFNEYENKQDKLDALGSANNYLLVNPNNLSNQAELLIDMAITSNDGKIDNDKIEHANRMIDKAIRLDKYDGKNYYLRGLIMEIKGDNQSALNDYEKSLTLNPYNDLIQHIYYIRLLTRTGLKEQALLASSSIISQYDDKTLGSKVGIRPYFAILLSELLKTRAVLYLEKNQKEQALNDIDRAQSINPSNKIIEELKNTQSQPAK